MKRLIFVTGRWSAIMAAAFLRSRRDYGDYENHLVHISHYCDDEYLKGFDGFCSELGLFERVICINYCVYEDSTPEGFLSGSIREKPQEECARLLQEKLNVDNFEEVIVPHLFSRKSRLLLEMFSSSRAYCIEEGLNSYFRHYGKKRINQSEQYFLSRLSGYITFNFQGLEPLFDFEANNVPIIIPPCSFLKQIIDELDSSGFYVPGAENENKVLFIGQIPQGNVTKRQLIEHYISAISSLFISGASVYFLKHPRDQLQIAPVLQQIFHGQRFYVLESADLPAEKIAEIGRWDAVVSYASSALVTVPALYGIPAFITEQYDLAKLHPGDGDFVNAGNLCGTVTPSLAEVLSLVDLGFSFKEAVLRVANEFVPDPLKARQIYERPRKKMTLEDHLAIPAELLRRKIKEKPYNSVLRVADALRQTRAWPGLKKALIAVALNPTVKINRQTLLFALKRFVANANPWSRQRQMRVMRQTRPGQKFLKAWDAAVSELKAKAIELEAFPSSAGGVAAIAYRPDKGFTGGPGGVLALQRAVLGERVQGVQLSYLFRDGKQRDDLYADIISGATFALEACQSGQHSHYIAHDLGTAFGLALARVPFVVVWHMQGSFVTQMLNFGHELAPKFIERLQAVEKIVMEAATSVVFPSNGAMDMYFADELRGAVRNNVTVGSCVYNTILPSLDGKLPTHNKILPAHDGLTFVSVGTITSAKGQDQIIDYFTTILSTIGQNVRWVCIGDGVMRDEIVRRSEELEKAHANFSFHYLGKIPHGDVMSVLKQADIYIMLHRISIFDFATLEAMANGCAIMLSKIGGNIDFDKAENVIFPDDVGSSACSYFDPKNVKRLQALNGTVLAEHFSAVAFKRASIQMIKDLIGAKASP